LDVFPYDFNRRAADLIYIRSLAPKNVNSFRRLAWPPAARAPPP
jgi:hypothetical protein